jgi:hypothetical protein
MKRRRIISLGGDAVSSLEAVETSALVDGVPHTDVVGVFDLTGIVEVNYHIWYARCTMYFEVSFHIIRGLDAMSYRVLKFASILQ